MNKKAAVTDGLDLKDLNHANMLKLLLKRLSFERKYNQAEDAIFEELDKHNSHEVYEAAVDYYNSLLNKTDKELEEGNFSREEVYQGLEDIKKYV